MVLANLQLRQYNKILLTILLLIIYVNIDIYFMKLIKSIFSINNKVEYDECIKYTEHLGIKNFN
jgi:hypothetical protein